MNREEVMKRLKKIQALYHVEQDKDSEQQEKFDSVRSKAKCISCSRFVTIDKELKEDIFRTCEKKRECVLVKNEYQKLLKIRKKYNDTCKVYSEQIFDILAEEKPPLLVRRTEERVSWDSVYTSEYNDLSDELCDVLISMIEEDGGRYRIVW